MLTQPKTAICQHLRQPPRVDEFITWVGEIMILYGTYKYRGKFCTLCNSIQDLEKSAISFLVPSKVNNLSPTHLILICQ